MRIRITIEYDIEPDPALSTQVLIEDEKLAWQNGDIDIHDVEHSDPSNTVKWEIIP